MRHGRADSQGEDYDKLTEEGFEQARKVGRWMSHSGYKFDRLIHGGLRRQRETLDAVLEELPHDELSIEIRHEYSEFDMKIYKTLARKLRQQKPEFSKLMLAWGRARKAKSSDMGSLFKKITTEVLHEWITQGDSFKEGESFPEFQKRVLAALAMAEVDEKDSTVKTEHWLAVTSGGPIALLCGKVMGLDIEQTLLLMRRVYNTSLHQLSFENDWALTSFNNVPHLSLAERTLV